MARMKKGTKYLLVGGVLLGAFLLTSKAKASASTDSGKTIVPTHRINGDNTWEYSYTDGKWYARRIGTSNWFNLSDRSDMAIAIAKLNSEAIKIK